LSLWFLPGQKFGLEHAIESTVVMVISARI
jgi:hypothetical protein